MHVADPDRPANPLARIVDGQIKCDELGHFSGAFQRRKFAASIIELRTCVADPIEKYRGTDPPL